MGHILPPTPSPSLPSPHLHLSCSTTALGYTPLWTFAQLMDNRSEAFFAPGLIIHCELLLASVFMCAWNLIRCSYLKTDAITSKSWAPSIGKYSTPLDRLMEEAVPFLLNSWCKRHIDIFAYCLSSSPMWMLLRHTSYNKMVFNILKSKCNQSV